MHQDHSALPEAAPGRGIELESFAHRSSGGYVRRLTLPDGRWWFPAGDLCRGLGLADVQYVLTRHVPEPMRSTLGGVCALHAMPLPNRPTWDGSLPLVSRSGVEALLAAPVAAGATAFTAWVRESVIRRPEPAAPVPTTAPRPEAIEISDFVHTATGARIRRLTMPDGSHWFPAADVCRQLGYSNTSQAIADHVADADRVDLQGLSAGYTLSVPAGRRWQRRMVMISLQGLIALVNGSRKPSAAPFKRWVAEVVATVQRDGYYGFSETRTIVVDESAGPADRFPIARFLAFVQRSEERQERVLTLLGESQNRFAEILVALLAKPAPAPDRAPDRPAGHAPPTDSAPGPAPAPELTPEPEPASAPAPAPAPVPGPAAGSPPSPRAVALPVPFPDPLPAGRPRTAPEILADWRARCEGPEEVWSVAAYVIPEMLLHGELVAVGERIGARLGLASSQVHRCLGFLRRHGCIRQVGLTPGVGRPVYVFG